jgi:hypothetical protein
VFIVAEMTGTRPVRTAHSSAACMRLLNRFLVDPAELRPLVDDMEHGADMPSDRHVVERLASALWGVFSHHRTVVDRDGNRVDLGSWRAAAELIADAVNRRYPALSTPIRYMDCYMGVLMGDERREEATALYRWIFSVLRDAGCDWVYGAGGENGAEEPRQRRREATAALSRAYREYAGQSVYAPLPAMVAAYQAVFGRLPEGWPA